jgi:nucleotide-binding universal stress UspA family protein
VFQPHLILCPIDFSENATLALDTALDLARQYRAEVLLLHVATTLGPDQVTYAEAVKELQPESHVRRLEEQLRRAVPADAGVPVRCVLREGDPARAVEEVVRSTGCDLVVVGTHGRTGLKHLLMGSIAERIVQFAPCPVLVLKYPHPG